MSTTRGNCTTSPRHARLRPMLRPLCLLLLALLLAGALVSALRVEAYTTTTDTVTGNVCPQFAMYEATDIGGTGFAPQLLALSAMDCSLDYVRKLPGLSPESSEVARTSNKAAAKQDQQTTDAAEVIRDSRVRLEIEQNKAEVGAS